MGDLMIVNGSPRAPRSHSKEYAALFSKYYPGSTAYFDITKNNHQALCTQMGAFSQVLFVFPLYADAIPVPLMDFMKFLEAHPPEKKPTVSVLINCGFLEPRQNQLAVRMMGLFCGQNQFPFDSVLMIGSGEAILNSPFRFLASGAIRRFARSVARERHGVYQVTMPLTKSLFVRAAASYWKNYGKKYGVTQEQMQTMEIESGSGGVRPQG